MTLGNTNGNNKGKKYLKIRGGEIITPENQIKYDKYSSWFESNYQKIRLNVSISSTYNDDIFNETFVNISNKILYGGLEISDYQSYFSRAYFTNHIQFESRVCDTVSISATHDQLEIMSDNRQDGSDMLGVVMTYVERKYTQTQYKIFYTYFTQMGDKTTFRSLARELNVSTFFIHTTIKHILKDIRHNTNLRNLYYIIFQ